MGPRTKALTHTRVARQATRRRQDLRTMSSYCRGALSCPSPTLIGGNAFSNFFWSVLNLVCTSRGGCAKRAEHVRPTLAPHLPVRRAERCLSAQGAPAADSAAGGSRTDTASVVKSGKGACTFVTDAPITSFAGEMFQILQEQTERYHSSSKLFNGVPVRGSPRVRTRQGSEADRGHRQPDACGLLSSRRPLPMCRPPAPRR